MWYRLKRYIKIKKGGKPKKGEGKGKVKPALIQYPANTMCEYVDQGKECPNYHKPGGCEFMHPEDGFDKMKEKTTGTKIGYETQTGRKTHSST